jgi:ABC-type transporter Mla subunit MlaD
MGYTVEQNGSSFDRGVAAGEISQRLKEHDKHFDQINGQMGRVADEQAGTRVELAGIKMQLQRMADGLLADKATVATTAEAVEKERVSTAAVVEKERATGVRAAERRWTPLTRIGIAAGILIPLAALIAYLYVSTHH